MRARNVLSRLVTTVTPGDTGEVCGQPAGPPWFHDASRLVDDDECRLWRDRLIGMVTPA